jgi:hypothetical protein
MEWGQTHGFAKYFIYISSHNFIVAHFVAAQRLRNRGGRICCVPGLPSSLLVRSMSVPHFKIASKYVISRFVQPCGIWLWLLVCFGGRGGIVN